VQFFSSVSGVCYQKKNKTYTAHKANWFSIFFLYKYKAACVCDNNNNNKTAKQTKSFKKSNKERPRGKGSYTTVKITDHKSHTERGRKTQVTSVLVISNTFFLKMAALEKPPKTKLKLSD